VIGFSTFLLGCIDYTSLRRHNHTRLSDIIVDHCVSRCVSCFSKQFQTIRSVRFSGFTLLFFLLFTAFYIWQLIAYAVGIQRLVNMYNFYTHLLKIPDVSFHYIPRYLSFDTYISLGRYTNHFMVGGCSANWRNSRREPSDCHIFKQGEKSGRHDHS
jgi:hypothetical protein